MLEDLITDEVAIRVVERFEVIQIGQHDRHRELMASGAAQFFVEPLQEIPSDPQAG